jgi:predicted transcriptional regulator
MAVVEELHKLTTTPTTEELLAETNRQLDQAHDQRRELIEARIRLDDHIARLEESKRVLVAPKRERRKRKPHPSTRTAAEHAGVGNIRRAHEILRGAGRATISQVAHQMNVNNGTVNYALRALEERGEIRKTGLRQAGSIEYEVVGKKRVSRPRGSRAA